MKTIEYKGPILQLAYPEFLVVLSKEPRWRAEGKHSSADVTITLNPTSHEAGIFARCVRLPRFGASEAETEANDINVVRQGEFRTSKGVTGHEQLVKRVLWRCWIWMLDARIRDQVLNIRMSVANEWWENGRIWEEFLNSIEWVAETGTGADWERYSKAKDPDDWTSFHSRESREPDEDDLKREIQLAMATCKNNPATGMLAQIPPDLSYVVQASRTCALIFEQDPETDVEEADVVIECIKEAMPRLTGRERKTRLRADMANLERWLEQNHDEHPEIGDLYSVLGCMHSLLLYGSDLHK